MIIDCDDCIARGPSCADCVVSFLTINVRSEAPPGLDEAERDAIGALAASGLVRPLRLVRAV